MKKLMLSLFVALAFTGSAYAAVDLNTATRAELESVKGIGPTKAKAIIQYRRQHGAFKKVDDLGKVKGFGAKTLDKLRGEVTVGGADKSAAK